MKFLGIQWYGVCRKIPAKVKNKVLRSSPACRVPPPEGPFLRVHSTSRENQQIYLSLLDATIRRTFPTGMQCGQRDLDRLASACWMPPPESPFQQRPKQTERNSRSSSACSDVPPEGSFLQVGIRSRGTRLGKPCASIAHNWRLLDPSGSHNPITESLCVCHHHRSPIVETQLERSIPSSTHP